MTGVLKALVLTPILAVAILFAVANRAPVTVQLDPLELTGQAISLSLPLFLVVFVAMALGVILGGVAVWLAQGRHRKAARLNAREAARHRAEIDRLRQEPGQIPALPPVSAIR